jgi:flagellar motor switch protein FliN
MSWETVEFKAADGQSLGAGASILPIWPMLRSAIAESISADALCPVTCGELTVGTITPATAPTAFEGANSFELLGTDRRGSWAAIDPSKGDLIGGKPYKAGRLQELVMEALSIAFESILGEGLNLGAPIEFESPDAPLLLLRLPLTSVDNEELILISCFDAAVAAELSAHIVALQALAADTSAPPPPAPQTVAQRTQDLKAATAPAPAPAPTVSGGNGNGNGFGNNRPAAAPANVRPAVMPELTASPAGQPTYNIDLLLGVNLQVAVEIGRTTLPIRDVLALTPGSIVELDKLAGEKVDVLINGRPIAQGEVVVVDENFGVRITDVVSRQARLTPQGR